MWIAGITLLLVSTSSICLFLGWRRTDPQDDIWDVAGTARTYTTIVGTLAGFSVTSSIFIANLTAARESSAFEGVMALFLIAFLIFISAAMQFGTTPNLSSHPTDAYRTIQGYSYVLANASFYIGLSLSWVGLPLLLSAIGLAYLAEVLMWLVLFAVLGGAMRLCASGLNLFAGIDLRVSLALPVICFGAASFYRIVLVELIADLLPDAHGPLMFAVVSFILAAIGFTLQSAMAGSVRRVKSALIADVGGRVLLAFIAGVVTTTSLLWLAVKDAL